MNGNNIYIYIINKINIEKKEIWRILPYTQMFVFSLSLSLSLSHSISLLHNLSIYLIWIESSSVAAAGCGLYTQQLYYTHAVWLCPTIITATTTIIIGRIQRMNINGCCICNQYTTYKAYTSAHTHTQNWIGKDTSRAVPKRWTLTSRQFAVCTQSCVYLFVCIRWG